MNDKKIILIITLIFLCLLPFFYLHQGLLLIDTGREFFIPQQMLKGGVLFKDIFNIYGALSYQINAFLFMIFGEKTDTLAAAGAVNSFLILTALYLISREFLSKTVSFLFAVFIMFSLVFQTFLYNSNLTYCFAIVYALSSFLFSLLFLIKYVKTKKPLYAYISCFAAGISLACKYEFALYTAVLIYALLTMPAAGQTLKPDSTLCHPELVSGSIGKHILKSLLYLIAAPVLSLGILFLQGLTLQDILLSAELIRNLVTAPLIKHFFFNIYLSVLHNGISGMFAVLPVLNAALLILNRREIMKDKALFIFMLAAIAASLKSFFCLNINHMGVFLLPVCALGFICIINLKYKKLLPFLLIVFIIIFAVQDFASLKDKSFYLVTQKGSIYTYPKDGMLIKQASDFILENTSPSDRVLVLPEGCMINFLTDRNGDNTYFNLNPLFYNDVFGGKRIIEHLSAEPPEYIIILPLDNREYGYSFFGRDYAQDFPPFLADNYKLIKNGNNMKIFKAEIKKTSALNSI